MQTKSPIVRTQDITPLKVLGAEVRFLCEGSATGNVWSLMDLTVPQRGGPPPHTHNWDEACYITAGEVQFTVGDQRFVATSGDFVYTPRGVAHGFCGLSKQAARMLIFDAPAHAAAFFKRVDREVKELPREVPKVVDIGRETGIHFL